MAGGTLGLSGSRMPLPVTSPYMQCPYPNPLAKVRLFCFPFAGGGASAYRVWGQQMPDFVEVCPIQLTGREERCMEPPHRRMETLTEVLVEQIQRCRDLPFAFYGHSMGALIAFELARTLRRREAPGPLALLLGAYQAPHLPPLRPGAHRLPKAEFIAELERFRGTPPEVLANQELVDFLLPVMRADFELCDGYRAAEEAPLDCPLVLYGGAQDDSVSQQQLENWRVHTRRSFALHMLPGHHLFLQSHRPLLLRSLSLKLQTSIPAQW
jgi:medium-chain acyl-[acyl-carrier-protein] hydrolase